MLVTYKGHELGSIDTLGFELNDWKDRDGIAGHCARTALYDILAAHPQPPEGEAMAPQAWILTVLKAICLVITGQRSETFEQQVFKRYTRHFGLSQMGAIVGHPVSSDMNLRFMFGEVKP